MKKLDHQVTLSLKLSEVAKDFGYKLEADSEEDVYHNGYSSDDVRFMDLNFPKGLDNLNTFFPSIVARAMESCERADYAKEIIRSNVSALEDCLLKIDLSGGGAEYQDLDGDFVSAKAGILSVKINEADDSIELTILNPEHLINTVINGVGMFSPDLSSTEPESMDQLKAKFHHLKHYFDVYGESKPSGEVSSQYSPSSDDEMFEEELKQGLDELTLQEVGEAVLELVEASAEDYEVNCKDFAKFVSFSAKEIKKEALRINSEKQSKIESKIN